MPSLTLKPTPGDRLSWRPVGRRKPVFGVGNCPVPNSTVGWWTCGILIAVCFGCTDSVELPGNPQDRLVVVLDAPPRAFDPRFTIDTMSAKISKLMFSSLIHVDNPDVVPKPHLAESITPDPDRVTRWHVQVRKDVVFHDGTPLTGRDVVYTFKSVLDPTLGSPYRADFDAKFRDVVLDPHDPYHVVFDLEQPLATFLTDLDMGIVPAHLLEDNVLGGRFAQDTWVGAGPFRFVRYDGHSTLVLRKADAHVGEPPSYEWLILRVLADDNARLLSILAGSADLMINGVSPILLDTLKSRDDVQVFSAPSLAFTYLGLNLRLPMLADARVRQALSAATNREEIIRIRFSGQATVARGILPSFHWAYFDQLPTPAFDPALAERLLDEAGYARDPVTGIRFSLELKLSNHRFRRGIAEMIARQWNQVGIEVNLRPYEFATFFADVQKGRFDVFLLQLPEPIEPDMIRWMLYSLQTPTKEPGAGESPYARWDRRYFNPGWETLLGDPLCELWARQSYVNAIVRMADSDAGHPSEFGSTNRTYYANPRLDCLVDLGRQTADRMARKQLYAEAQALVARDLPILPLWHENHLAIGSPRLRGVSLLPTSRLSFVTRLTWSQDWKND